MSNNKKAIDIENSDDEIEFKNEVENDINPTTTKTTKNGKPKKPYVLTDARKAQFEKARIKRMENITAKRQLDEEKYSKYEDLKINLEIKKDKKLKKQKEKELITLLAETENISSDDEEEIIEKRIHPKKEKKPRQAKQKKAILQSESESESDTEEYNKPKALQRKQQPGPKVLKSIIQFIY